MSALELILPSSILLAASIDDLRSRKIHNWLVLTCMILAITLTFYNGGLDALQMGVLGCGAAILFLLPLVLMKALGAGDLKIMMAFGLATNWSITLNVVMYSLICGALLGLIRAFVAGQAKTMALNMISILRPGKEVESKNLQKIPFSIALLFGWMTYVSLTIKEFPL